MFDNGMNGAVGFAMHEDRLARATRNLRMLEAEEVMAFARDEDRARVAESNLRLSEAKATSAQRQPMAGRAYRSLVAKTLIALAMRIAPPASVPTIRTQTTAR